MNKLVLELQTLLNKALNFLKIFVNHMSNPTLEKLDEYSSLLTLTENLIKETSGEKPIFTQNVVFKPNILEGRPEDQASFLHLKREPPLTLLDVGKGQEEVEFQNNEPVKSYPQPDKNLNLLTEYLVDLSAPLGKSILQNFEPEVAQAHLRDNIISSIVRSAVLIARSGHSEMKISLKPEHLGELHLQVIVEQQRVIAHFQTQSVAVKEIIENNLPQLRQQLQNAGIDIDAFNVSLSQNWTTSSSSQQEINQGFNQKVFWERIPILSEGEHEEMISNSPLLSSRINYWA